MKLLLFGLIAFAVIATPFGKGNSKPTPTLIVSCAVCSASAPINFSGSGYPQSQGILLELTNPDGVVVLDELFPAQGNNGGSFSWDEFGYTSDAGTWTAATYSFHYPDTRRFALATTFEVVP